VFRVGRQDHLSGVRATSGENVEVVREAWDAYSRGDYYERVEGFHDPHIVVITLDDGAVYGNDAVLATSRATRKSETPHRLTRAQRLRFGRGANLFLWEPA
jgi:hypothetical protein